MINKILIVVGLAIIGFVFFGTTFETSDTPTTVTKKVGDGYKMNVLQDTSTKVTQELGKQAIEQGCKVPNSQMCWTSQWVVFTSTLALAILFIGLTISGLVAVIKIVASIF